MNIAQISNLSGRGANLLARMLEVAPLFQFAEFKPDPSTYVHIADKDSFSGSAARAEGGTLQRDAQVPNPESRNLALYGREISIDDVRKMDANVGVSPAGLRLFADRRLNGLGAKLAVEVQDEMLVGVDASNRMLGISYFVKDADATGQTPKLGFTADELAAMNVQVGLKLDTDANQKAFVELLEKEMANVPGANAILCNVNLGARLSTIARTIGAAGVTTNNFGQPVQTFNGVPIVKLPVSAIPQNESDGVNTDNTSLYIVRFAEELGVAFSTNSGFLFTDFEESEVGPQGIARLQFFLNLTVERQDALRRLSRIRL
ncbi:hypothetical protein Calab_1525 [Caldithrix abyssi DSM 13497]|uniref:Phage major capsid protein, HK97 family n=1 Tax=Caldithrix abyssi DSM 13497 TaxID=880073 RepID=H1XQJ9_CALAY|nr:hypothetical protein [Caldithrix abyssi]APF16988.1 hypothetical protein Cabys_237 [Caldithrix abyssi DSM 13497]APF20323.1 hypothetical protein Cabys_3577 [Caldithrix abyssi DSM 13497]EHO40373.1 hypothetical protein Calab_0734 [Caldithrix abyssi DSM 13497]EHO41145.1 hypothetical protein Calab_1525 [Caldithrix abyssi DSM 13497]